MHRSTPSADPVVTGLRPGPGALAGSGTPGPLDTRHMPFIALTAGEEDLWIPELVKGTRGWIDYRDPTPYDRYPDTEVLLQRTRGALPSGRPNGSRLCPYRQAHCMINFLCQGCAAPAATDPQGRRLWVLPATRRTGEGAATTGYTDMPPSCARCATHWCPVLSKRGRKLLWADLVAVYATLFLPGMGCPVEERLVSLDDERMLSAAVATRYVRKLGRVVEADPAAIADLALQQAGQ